MKNFRKQFLKIGLPITIFVMIAFPLTSVNGQAGITDRMLGAIKTVALPGTEEGGDIEATTQNIIGNLVNSFLSVFGIFFLALMLYGGYKWMNARGKEEELTKAKDILRSAIIGFIIVMLAYAISYFAANALQGAVTP